jgi:rhodanese-related sulfurtransferase
MIQTLSPREAAERIDEGRLDVIDVREAQEWCSGHIAGARWVPLALLRANPAAALPRDGVLFVCAAGVRSEAAARVALSAGLRAVFNLSGGTRAWSRAGLPLELEEVVTAAE